MQPSTNSDLSRLRAIAEEGRAAPLLGGWHLILWGCAITLALLLNWAIITRALPWPGYAIAIGWFGIVAVAWVGSAMLGRRGRARPGALSVGNRVETTAWITGGAFLSSLAVAIFVRANLADSPAAWGLFMIIAPVTFGVYAIALDTSAVAAESASMKPWVVLSLAFAALTALLIGDPAQYPIAAAGVLLVSVLPGLAHLRAERRAG